MTDIEKKAREYAKSDDGIGKYDYLGNEYEAYVDGVVDGAKFALGNQWRDAEKEKPTHNHLVLAEVEVDTPEIRFCTAYYQDGIWVMPDDFYYDCKVLRWLPIPEYKPKGE